MKICSIGTRLIANTLMLVTVTCGVFGIFTWYYFSMRTANDAKHEATRESQQLLARIASIDELTSQQVQSAMRMLQREGGLKGGPELRGTATVAGKTVPNLYLGSLSQVENFEIVDRVRSMVGGSATLFVWDGSNFTRVSTNVMKADGSRALGTVLDGKGKAYAALTQGEPFHGVVNILGAPYTTSYVPIKNAAGKMVGAYYTGYKLDSIAAISASVAESKILDHGFVAIAEPSGNVLFHSSEVSGEQIAKVRSQSSGWNLVESSYPAWGYKVVTAYPKMDVFWRTVKTLEVLTAETVVLVGLIFALQLILLKRQVMEPVKELTGHMDNANLNTVLEVEGCGEISNLSYSFNAFVARLRQSLLDVHDRAQATYSKSNEILEIANASMSSMAEQRQYAMQATEVVSQLCEEIANTSSHTSDASVQARSAAEAARKGGELVHITAARMEQLASDTQESAGRVAALSDRVQQIGSIVEVINEIAAGTNLLALNASIEAARAGEHGRGFAVVAGEVRRLAERTAQATQQVAALVSGIREETSRAATEIGEACTHARQGADAVSSLNLTFDNISKLVFEVDERIARIAEAAQQEANSADQATNNMLQVAQSVANGASGAEKVVAASSDLMSIGDRLNAIVNSFNVAHDR
jgi:methyl-accepting chemotaxis protein